MTLLDLPLMLLAGLAAPWWMRKPRHGWPERFGKNLEEPLSRFDGPGGLARPRVLLHAVSVGEVQALRALVPMLAADFGVDVVVSVGTDTGFARAESLFAGQAAVVRYPLDFSWAVRRFLDAVRPDAVGLVELELWPQFLDACTARGVPVAVINGRLSERSFRGYRRARTVVGPMMFRKLRHAAVQDDAYAERFRAMGVPEGRVSVTGSMKWDALRVPDDGEDVRNAASRAMAADMGIDLSRPIVVAGSTAEDEERLLVQALSAGPPSEGGKLASVSAGRADGGLGGSGVQLLCAPRKPEHFSEGAAAMPGCVRRSEPGSGSPSSGLFLLDTIGELSTAYRLADVVVMGRSFGSLHGSDPAEPAALGKPVLIGPRFGDFETAVSALRDAGALRIANRPGRAAPRPPGCLGVELDRLLGSPEEREAMGDAARACVRAQQGASVLHAELLRAIAGQVRSGRDEI